MGTYERGIEIERAAVFGRFQPFHVDHLTFVEDAARRARKLLVAVTRPYPSVDEPGEHRVQPEANPLPYWLRAMVITEALLGVGLDDRVTVAPVPLRSDVIALVVRPDTVLFSTILDEWGERKEAILRASGRQIERLPVRHRRVSGTQLRGLIERGDPTWRRHLPPGVSRETQELVRLCICDTDVS